MFYKIIFIFLLQFLFINILFSSETNLTGKNEILIKYSLSQNNFSLFAVNPLHKKMANSAFCNNKNNRLYIEIYSRLGFLKLFSIFSNTTSYIETNYNNKLNTLFLDSVLGEFEIVSLNTHITTITKIDNIEITNYASTYKIISYPKTNIYIFVTEGKINIKKNNDSIILIAGESLEITPNSFQLSEIKDFDTAKNIISNKMYAQSKNILITNNYQINYLLKKNNGIISNNNENLNKIKFYSLENIFIYSSLRSQNFGTELKNNISKNNKLWKDILHFSTIK